MKVNNTLSGRYLLRVVGSEGLRRSYSFDNMVVDNGLEQIGTDTVNLTYCQVGRNANPATPLDTNLYYYNAYTSIINEPINFSKSQTKDNVLETNITYEFPFGAITQDITEISVGNQINTDIFSRALIRDALGNPTSIKVGPDEGLFVTYTVETHVNAADTQVTKVINGVNTVITIRPSMLGVGSAWTPVKTGLQTDVGSFALASDLPMLDNLETPIINQDFSADKFSSMTYTPLSHQRTHAFKFGKLKANFPTGIKTVFIRSNTPFLGAYQLEFNPAIAKTEQNTLSFNLTIGWGRKGSN